MDSEVKQRLDAELAKFDGSGADVGKLSSGIGSLNTKLALYIADKLDQLDPGGGGGGKDNNVSYGSSKRDPKTSNINIMWCVVFNADESHPGVTHWYHRKNDGTEELIPFDYEKPYLIVPFVGTNATGDTTYDWIGLRDADGENVSYTPQFYAVTTGGWDATYKANKIQCYAGTGYWPIMDITLS